MAGATRLFQESVKSAQARKICRTIANGRPLPKFVRWRFDPERTFAPIVNILLVAEEAIIQIVTHSGRKP